MISKLTLAVVILAAACALIILAGATRVSQIPSDTPCPYLRRQRNLGIALLVAGSVGFLAVSILGLCKGGLGGMDCGASANAAGARLKRVFGAEMARRAPPPIPQGATPVRAPSDWRSKPIPAPKKRCSNPFVEDC